MGCKVGPDDCSKVGVSEGTIVGSFEEAEVVGKTVDFELGLNDGSIVGLGDDDKGLLNGNELGKLEACGVGPFDGKAEELFVEGPSVGLEDITAEGCDRDGTGDIETLVGDVGKLVKTDEGLLEGTTEGKHVGLTP